MERKVKVLCARRSRDRDRHFVFNGRLARERGIEREVSYALQSRSRTSTCQVL